MKNFGDGRKAASEAAERQRRLAVPPAGPGKNSKAMGLRHKKPPASRRERREAKGHIHGAAGYFSSHSGISSWEMMVNISSSFSASSGEKRSFMRWTTFCS